MPKMSKSAFLDLLSQATGNYRNDREAALLKEDVGASAQEKGLPVTSGLARAIMFGSSRMTMDGLSVLNLWAATEKAWEEYLALPENT